MIGAGRSAREQALGRSRGGLSTEVVAVVADEDTVVAVDIVPGQAGDAPLLVPMLERTEVDEIVGDKGFDGDQLRCDCLNREVNPNIPLKKNRDPDLWAFDADNYKERNRVERLFGKAKQFRRSTWFSASSGDTSRETSTRPKTV